MFFHQAFNSVGNHSYNAVFYENVFWDYHFHKNYELIYVLEGKVESIISDRSMLLEAGDFAICLSNEIHSYRSIGDSRAWVCVFSGDFVHSFDKVIEGKAGKEYRFRCSQPVMTYLKECLITETMPNLLRLKSCLYVICDEFLAQTELVDRSEKNLGLMNAISDYVSENYCKKITLAQIAEQLGYNYCYLSKAFHKIFRMSFASYMNTYRFGKACELLIETERSITDVAMESGFQSIRSFNEIFCQMAGVSPGKYRKLHHDSSKQHNEAVALLPEFGVSFHDCPN